MIEGTNALDQHSQRGPCWMARGDRSMFPHLGIVPAVDFNIASRIDFFSANQKREILIGRPSLAQSRSVGCCQSRRQSATVEKHGTHGRQGAEGRAGQGAAAHAEEVVGHRHERHPVQVLSVVCERMQKESLTDSCSVCCDEVRESTSRRATAATRRSRWRPTLRARRW